LLSERLSLQDRTTMAADHITLMIMVLGMATILTTMAGVTVPTTMAGVLTTTNNRIRITAIDIGQSTKVEKSAALTLNHGGHRA